MKTKMTKNQDALKGLSLMVKPLMVSVLIVLGSTTNIVFAQNWNQVIKAVASDRAAYDFFGGSVAISGDYAIVGAPFEDHNATGGSALEGAGSAYIFKINAGTWTQVQKIVASDREANDQFGYSVAISGDYAIVGASRESHNAAGGAYLEVAGSAYIFKNNAGTWEQVRKIVASDRATGDAFGWSVAISEEFSIVGAFYESEDATGGNTRTTAGSAYIYENNAGSWTQLQKIVALDRTAYDVFGCSVAISGDYIIVGAYGEDATAGIPEAGAAYIFKNNTGTWTQLQKIVAPDRGLNDYFGYSVAISGNNIIVGAYWEDEDATGGNSHENAGSAYIFSTNGGTWSLAQKIVASDRWFYDNFGLSVSISGNYAIVGANQETEDAIGGNTLTSSGSAYIFKNNAGTWSQVQKIVASDRGAEDYFGGAVGISGAYAIVTAPQEDHNATGGSMRTSAGSAYIFVDSTIIGIEENSFGNGLLVYPNPTNGKFSIDLGAYYENAEITITDISGKLIETKTIAQSQVLHLSIDEPAGVYFVSIQAGDKKAVVRLVKE